MIKPERPDVDNLSLAVRNYIEYLEEELEKNKKWTLHQASKNDAPELSEVYDPQAQEISEPAEAPTTFNLITATLSGTAKRTPRHFYNQQRRGGMGVFDLETHRDNPPALLAIADSAQSLLLLTSTGRTFRLPVSSLSEKPIRARGDSIVDRLELKKDEYLAAILSDQAQGYVTVLSEKGYVRHLRHHVFGEYMKPGTSLYDYSTYGALVAACWSPGDMDMFVSTRQGRAIRFAEKLISPNGAQAIRLAEGDSPVGITSVSPSSGVFLLGANGKGIIRLMSGFSANKSPGGGGKIALNTDHLVCSLAVDDHNDIFIITRLSKLIRFSLDDMPQKEGVVQGVNCISLRADEPVAAVPSGKVSVL